MTKKTKAREELIERAVWIYCHYCGTEYVEPKAWLLEDNITECPVCHSRLGVASEGEEI